MPLPLGLMTDGSANDAPRPLSQNTYIFVWILASVSSVAIFIRFF